MHHYMNNLSNHTLLFWVLGYTWWQFNTVTRVKQQENTYHTHLTLIILASLATPVHVLESLIIGHLLHHFNTKISLRSWDLSTEHEVWGLHRGFKQKNKKTTQTCFLHTSEYQSLFLWNISTVVIGSMCSIVFTYFSTCDFIIITVFLMLMLLLPLFW